MLNDNAGVQRLTHIGQKPTVEEQAKSKFDLYLQYGYEP